MVVNQQVPGYPGVSAGHSFDLNEMRDDSDEDEVGLTSAPPPAYTDVIGDPPSRCVLRGHVYVVITTPTIHCYYHPPCVLKYYHSRSKRIYALPIRSL